MFKVGQLVRVVGNKAVNLAPRWRKPLTVDYARANWEGKAVYYLSRVTPSGRKEIYPFYFNHAEIAPVDLSKKELKEYL